MQYILPPSSAGGDIVNDYSLPMDSGSAPDSRGELLHSIALPFGVPGVHELASAEDAVVTKKEHQPPSSTVSPPGCFLL